MLSLFEGEGHYRVDVSMSRNMVLNGLDGSARYVVHKMSLG